MNFCLSRGNNSGFSLHLGDAVVHPTQNVRFLGLVLDPHLSFHSHIQYISNKINSGIFILRNLKRFVNKDVLLAAYYGLVYPHLVYAVPIWGSETQKTLFLFKLQKRAVRTVFSLPRRQSCREYFREFKILTLPSIYILETLNFVKKYPSKFNFSVKPPYQLRNAYNFSIPKHSTSFFKKNLVYNGIKFFNCLPLPLKLESNPLKFKILLKSHLIDLTCYSVQEFILAHSNSE